MTCDQGPWLESNGHYGHVVCAVTIWLPGCSFEAISTQSNVTVIFVVPEHVTQCNALICYRNMIYQALDAHVINLSMVHQFNVGLALNVLFVDNKKNMKTQQLL